MIVTFMISGNIATYDGFVIVLLVGILSFTEGGVRQNAEKKNKEEDRHCYEINTYQGFVDDLDNS
jgi:hypothetical protein